MKAYEQEHDVSNKTVAPVDHVQYMKTETFSYKAGITFDNQTDTNSITDTKEYEQEHDVINEPIAPVDHMKYMMTETLNCKADFTFNNLTGKIGNMGANGQKHDTDMHVTPVDHVKCMMMKTLSWKSDITFNDQTDDVSITETKESEQGNYVIYKSEIDDVRADAAAAITITNRGTYVFYAYMSNAGNERDPVKKVFETETWPDAFQSFQFFDSWVWWCGKSLTTLNKNLRAKTKNALFDHRGSSMQLQRMSSTI